MRHDRAAEYRGEARVVYGHTRVSRAEWLKRTICLDTGCAFGGHLTALRYPEMESVSIPAAWAYAEPVRPFPAPTPADPASADPATAQQDADDLDPVPPCLGCTRPRRGGRASARRADALTASAAASRA